MSAKLRDLLKQVPWYYYSAGIAFTAGVNLLGMATMGEAYHWYFAEDDQKLKAFQERYGLPTEQQRMEIFKWLAPRWDQTYGKVERSGAAVYRKELLQRARGSVLDVCMGTGSALEALPTGGQVTSYTGVDIIEGMLLVAQPKLPTVSYPAKVVCADAHCLPFPERSFDTVIGSLALCSLERPAEALSEMARVCKLDGQVLLLEPGLADNAIIRAGQRYLGLVPNAKHAWEVGWYDDRDPPALLKACPCLVVEVQQTRTLGNWYLIRARPCHEEQSL